MNERAIHYEHDRTGPLWRIALLIAATLALVISMVGAPTTALADTVFEPDGSETGLLTLHKYDLGEDGEFDPDAVTQEEIEEALTQIQDDYSPIEGVVFSYLRVGSAIQYVDEDDNGQITIGYSVNSSYWTDLGLSEADCDYEDEDGNHYFTTKTLSDALANLTQTQLESFMSSNGATAMTATNASGTTTATGLQLGLYLVVETVYPSSTYMTTEPFFVSIPMTDYSSDGGWTWEYDVVAIPKNRTEPFEIWKSVVEGGHETNAIDGEIGQVKTFVIRADVPAVIYNMQTYTITDTLGEGITISGTPVVYGLADGAREQLANGTEYTYDASGQTLTFSFNGAQMGEDVDNQNVAKYTMVEIRYEAYLNAEAVVGGEGNSNDAYLTYSKFTGTGSETEQSEHDSATIYTYGIDLLKYGEDGVEDTMDGVTFELYRDEGLSDKIDLSLSTDETYYYVTGTTGGSVAETVQTANGGKLVIRGLEAGTYYLKETGTLTGYNLLIQPIEITITSNEATFEQNAEGTYVQTATSGDYYLSAAGERWEFDLPSGTADGAYVNFGKNAVYSVAAEGSAIDKYAPADYSASGADFTLDEDSGLISLYVENSKGFDLPLTGGSAVPWLLIGGAIVSVAIVSIKLSTSKKSDASA